jgi:hypothetical protein
LYVSTQARLALPPSWIIPTGYIGFAGPVKERSFRDFYTLYLYIAVKQPVRDQGTNEREIFWISPASGL